MIHCATDTAVVILSFNGRDLHHEFLPLIVEESKGQYDVVLIDNASTDDTYNYVKENFSSVQLVQHKINNGFSQGYHDGLKQIKAKYYVLLSADFEVSKGWFDPIHTAIDQDDNIAAIQPKILYQKDKTLFEYAGAGGGFMDKWGYMFCRGRLFDTLEKDENQYDDNVEVFWAGGGCFFVRADLYHQFNGLDLDFYAHMEEIDLCWRMKNAGYKIAYCGESTVYHVGGSVISYGSPQKLFYNYRNNLALLLKNDSFSRLWWLLPWRLVLDGVSAIPHLLKGDFKSIGAIIKAHFSFYGMMPSLLKKRRANRRLWENRNFEGVYYKSVIAQYFISKKTKASELPGFNPRSL